MNEIENNFYLTNWQRWASNSIFSSFIFLLLRTIYYLARLPSRHIIIIIIPNTQSQEITDRPLLLCMYLLVYTIHYTNTNRKISNKAHALRLCDEMNEQNEIES